MNWNKVKYIINYGWLRIRVFLSNEGTSQHEITVCKRRYENYVAKLLDTYEYDLVVMEIGYTIQCIKDGEYNCIVHN